MNTCVEYFDCHKTECVMYNSDEDRPCWEVEGTLCSSLGMKHLQKLKGGKKEGCKACLYYQDQMSI